MSNYTSNFYFLQNINLYLNFSQLKPNCSFPTFAFGHLESRQEIPQDIERLERYPSRRNGTDYSTCESDERRQGNQPHHVSESQQEQNRLPTQTNHKTFDLRVASKVCYLFHQYFFFLTTFEIILPVFSMIMTGN